MQCTSYNLLILSSTTPSLSPFSCPQERKANYNSYIPLQVGSQLDSTKRKQLHEIWKVEEEKQQLLKGCGQQRGAFLYLWCPPKTHQCQSCWKLKLRVIAQVLYFKIS